MLKKLVRFLGSVNLALLLLAVLIVANIIGTLCEKNFSTEVAQTYVYGAWWFVIWLSILCVNVFCAAAVRFPFRRHQFGFVATHAGIIVILIGGMIDRQYGTEGNIRLVKGEPPASQMSVHGEDLLVETDGVAGPARTPFSMALLKQRNSVSLRAASPSEDVRVDVVEVKPVGYRTGDAEPAENGVPAIRWSIRSPMLGSQGSWLFLGDGVSFGQDQMRVVIRFVRGAEKPPEGVMASLYFSLDSEGNLRYYRRSARSGEAEGVLEVGKEVPLPWGQGSTFVVEEFLPSARPSIAWSPSDNKEATPGLRCRVEVKGESALVWVGPQLMPPAPPWQEVRVGGKTVRLRLDQRTQELPFSLQLVKFNAPEHEGQSGHYVLFESVLRFNGQEGSEQTASMNNPATYPSTWYGPLLGTSYRISQASHEPGRNDVSIVQVLRDPGWFPKWFGSLLVCGGIFATFYLRKPAAGPTETPVKDKAP